MDSYIVEGCPFGTAQNLLGGKWTLIILYFLGTEGVLRFNELQRKLGGLTHATLAKQLQGMEKRGLIIRTVYPQIPPKVEYSLTDMAKKLCPTLESLRLWSEEYIALYREEN